MGELLSKLSQVLSRRREQPTVLTDKPYPVGDKCLFLSRDFGDKFVTLLEDEVTGEALLKSAQKITVKTADDPIMTGAKYVRYYQPEVIVGGVVTASELVEGKLEQLVAKQLGLPPALADQSGFRDRLAGRQGVMVLVIINGVCEKDVIDKLKRTWSRVSREGQLVVASLEATLEN